MDSEHRHELEENALARWLADKVEGLKAQAPLLLLGAVAVVAGLVGWNGWQKSSIDSTAERWRDFAVALESGSPDLIDLKTAAETNPGTPVAEWAEVTWADGKLFEASQLYFQSREQSNAAAAEALAAYERLISAKDRDVADRAAFQLGRVLELQGKLDEAAEQYARVTGAFAAVAKGRAAQLETPTVREAYEWIVDTTTTAGPPSSGSQEGTVGLDPDDIPLPNVDPEDANAALDELLKGVEEEAGASADAQAVDPPAVDDSPEGDGAPDDGAPDDETPDEGDDSADSSADDEAAPGEE